MVQPGDVTVPLDEARTGRGGALDELMDRVYSDLERIAIKHPGRRFGENARLLVPDQACADDISVTGGGADLAAFPPLPALASG